MVDITQDDRDAANAATVSDREKAIETIVESGGKVTFKPTQTYGDLYRQIKSEEWVYFRPNG